MILAMDKLIVTKVRYFETLRGLGYECETNVDGVTICNDGNGGATYVDCNAQNRIYSELTEDELESLIDIFEVSKMF